jgi:hypothetical protein
MHAIWLAASPQCALASPWFHEQLSCSATRAQIDSIEHIQTVGLSGFARPWSRAHQHGVVRTGRERRGIFDVRRTSRASAFMMFY